MMKSIATVATCVALGAAMTGCTLRLNQRAGLAGTALPALDMNQPATPPDTQQGATPSLTDGHDRGHWQAVTVAVPVNQVQHHPTYNDPIDLTDLSHRDDGSFPTAVDATRREPMTWGHLWEIDCNTLGFVWALVTSPWEMTVGGQPPFEAQADVRFSPYARTPNRMAANLSRWWALPPAKGETRED